MEGKRDGAGPPPTATELSSTHAQLQLIGEAIRAASADLALPPPLPPASATTTRRSQGGGTPLTTADATPHHQHPILSPSNLNGTPVKQQANGPAQQPVLISATDRLAALHDHLRRVQWLMKEYEATCQRAVEMHLQPSTEEDGTGDAGDANSKAKAAAARPELPSPSRRTAPQKPQAGNKQSSNAAAVKDTAATSGPSLHQRRALASDAAFTRFCGLRVDPEHLLLPWGSTPTAGGNASAFGAGGRQPQEKEEGQSALHTIVAAGGAHLGNGRPESSCSTASMSSTGSGHSQASTTLRMAQQQRQQVAATAHLSAYSRFFLNPKAPLALTPMPPPPSDDSAKAGAAVDAFLASAAATSDPVNGPAVLLRQLRDTQSQFEALRRCRLFGYEGRLREQKNAAAAAAASSAGQKAITAGTAVEEPKWEHTSVLVARMAEVLTALRTRFASESHYAFCGTPSVALGRQVHAWTQPLLRQLNELLSNPAVEDVDQDLREKLRRMKFDAEELQQEQTDAITNGDMQRSEELYYEQTALLEAMKTPYDEMEQLLQEYSEECVASPLAALTEQKETLNARLTRIIEEHAGRLAEVAQDIDRVKEKRRTVVQSRHRQRNAMSAYQHTWKKQWQGNSDQQMACYRAMEQLERRLSNLQRAQSVLAEDWLSRMALERQREEDAAAFTYFAEARTQALTESQRNLQSVVDGLRQLNGAVLFSCSHAEAFARDVLQGHVNDTQLALRKDRLAQFRSLYLTLGDWRFKKSRNADEMQKKIEYYTLQQELAMDVSNPKAKEYSQSKQQWEAARAEALVQLDLLDNRSRLQLEAFKPTEDLLRAAGVDFVSPEDELAERTLQRTQRLVEYQQLIEEGIGVRSGAKGPAAIAAPPVAEGRPGRSGNGNFAATQRLPALPPTAAAAAAAAAPPMRPATADVSGGSIMHPRLSRESAGETRRETPPPTMAAVAAATTASPRGSLDDARGGGTGSVGSPAALPPILGKLPTPPQLHSTEERIMRDITKTAALGAGAEGNGGGNGKSQKRKSTK